MSFILAAVLVTLALYALHKLERQPVLAWLAAAAVVALSAVLLLLLGAPELGLAEVTLGVVVCLVMVSPVGRPLLFADASNASERQEARRYAKYGKVGRSPGRGRAHHSSTRS